MRLYSAPLRSRKCILMVTSMRIRCNKRLYATGKQTAYQNDTIRQTQTDVDSRYIKLDRSIHLRKD